MKKCSAALLNRLNTATSLCLVDLITFTLVDGTVLRFTSLPYTFKCGNYNYVSMPIDVGSMNQSLGFNVDDLALTMYYDTDTITINNKPVLIPRALRSGAFRWSTCEHSQVFMEQWALSESEDYRLILFVGRTEVENAGRTTASLKIESFNKLLTTKSPPNVYQAGCINPLYGYVCGLNEDDWTETYTILSGSTQSVLYVSANHSSGYYQSGFVKFANGDNYGLSRTIKSHTYNSVTGIATLNLLTKLDYTPVIGDTVKLTAGCDHSISTCKNRFNNYPQGFRGTPFVPLPRVTGGG